jgi:type I restriction enzyme M protein
MFRSHPASSEVLGLTVMMAAALIPMSEIARLAEVKLPTVSNWRRRHASFPRSERRDGQELFAVEEIANWLDMRKIAKGDLKDGETPGATYGARFRRMYPGIVPNLDARQKEALRQDEALWQELNKLRGAEDVATYADVALGLFYLSVRDRGRWSDIAAADGFTSGQSLEQAIFELGRDFSVQHRSWRSITLDPRGGGQLSEIIRAIDRVRRRVEHGAGLPGQRPGDVFEYLVNKFAADEGKRGAVVATPRSVAAVLVDLIAPKPGESLLDPCIGSGSFLLEAAKYIEARGGHVSDGMFAAQAMLERSCSIVKMSLDLHDLPVNLAPRPAIALDDNLHADRQFDAILANPPFNMLVRDNDRRDPARS